MIIPEQDKKAKQPFPRYINPELIDNTYIENIQMVMAKQMCSFELRKLSAGQQNAGVSI